MENTLHKITNNELCTADEAFAAFDALPTVSTDDMLGRWTLQEVLTGHRLDGLLEKGGLHGKIFLGTDDVHPLVFIASDKKEIYAVNPKLVPLEVDLPKDEVVGTLIETARFLLETKESKARLRMVEFRGRGHGLHALRRTANHRRVRQDR